MTLHSTLGLATQFAFHITFMMAAGTTWPLCLLARQPPCCLLVTMATVEQLKSFHYSLHFTWTPAAPSDWAEAVPSYLELNLLRGQCASLMWYPQDRLTTARPFASSAEKMTPTGQHHPLPCCLYLPQWCSHPHLIIPLQSCPL